MSVQALVDNGIFEEDPEGRLWMSDKMKTLIDEFNKDEKIKALITKKAKNENDYKTGCWSYIYMRYVENCPTPELKNAVAVLKGWDKAARDNELDEWSMGLRLR